LRQRCARTTSEHAPTHISVILPNDFAGSRRGHPEIAVAPALLLPRRVGFPHQQSFLIPASAEVRQEECMDFIVWLLVHVNTVIWGS
jgi:hypothetical protein